jgi:hypothetical protein
VRTMIGHKIQHKDDPIAGNADLQKTLQDHSPSILNQLNYGIPLPRDSGPNYDVLEDDWTLNWRGTE